MTSWAPWLLPVYIRDEILPMLHGDFQASQYQDPYKTNQYLGGGFKHFLFSPRNPGEMFQFDQFIFLTNGLVQPPIRLLFVDFSLTQSKSKPSKK